MKKRDVLTIIFFLGLAVCLLAAAAPSGICAVKRTQPAPSPAPSPGTPAAGSTSASAPPAAGKGGEVSGSALKLYMPDGQLISHTIRIYVSGNIQPEQSPRLQLLRSHAVTEKAMAESRRVDPALVAPGQEWIETVGGVQVRRTGTLLLFDLSSHPFGLRGMIRVLPVVSWTEAGATRLAVGAGEVNIGNIVNAIAWTLAIVGVALLIVIGLSWRAAGNPLLFLAGADGQLSLAQTQVACWTVAVGSVVLGYGFIRLEIPEIPTSLIVLMGASLTTGGVGYFKDAQKLKRVAARRTTARRSLRLGDLVTNFSAETKPELSLAKGQMLFWTLLLLVLFIAKSILDGAIWAVPWPLVALMGFSQVGYLAPKLAPQP